MLYGVGICAFIEITLTHPLSILTGRLDLETVVSGQNILAMAREAGADITVAVNKCVASTSKERQQMAQINFSFSFYQIVKFSHKP